MRNVSLGVAALVGLLAAVAPAMGQGYYTGPWHTRSLGRGPSSEFYTNLPSYGINRTLGTDAGFTRASQFFARPAPQEASYLAAPGIAISLARSTWNPVTASTLAPGRGPGTIAMAPVRSLGSLNFANRARFAKLRETTLALAERVRKSEESGLSQVSANFRQFMFPFPLVDQPKMGYGFFSRTDLVGGGDADAEAFLAPFTPDVQQSLGEERFLDVAEALLVGRPLKPGVQLDQLYDTQLAALGNYLFNGARYRAAAECWRILADRDPSSAMARRAMALCLLGDRQMPQAAAEVRRSLTMTPGWPDQVRITGSNFQDVFPNSRDLEDARAELQAQLARKPDDPDLGLLLAFMDVFQGRWDEAQQGLEKLAAAGDDVAKGLLGRLTAGAVSATIRRPIGSALKRIAADLTGLEEAPLSPEAREQLIAALREGPRGYEDFMRLGDFRFFMGQFTEAGEVYRAAHKDRPQDAFALFAMTHASFANGEYRLAARTLPQALALEPNWGLFEFRLQEFYGDREEYAQHVKNLERQVELRPGLAEVKFLLAYIYYFSGRYADATDLLVQVVRLEPGFEAANYFLRLSRLQG